MTVSSSPPKSSPTFDVLALLLQDARSPRRSGCAGTASARARASTTSRSRISELGAALRQHALHDDDEEVLGQIHVAVEIHERDLGLDHPELGEVAARLGLLGAEGRAEAVDAAERHRARLAVELARLRQVGLLAEVVDLEEGGRPLAAFGVKIGASMSVKPRVSKKSRTALMISWRTRRIACCRFERSHRWRCSIRKSVPCSFGEIG